MALMPTGIALNLATLRHREPHQMGQSTVIISYARQLAGVFALAVVAASLMHDVRRPHEPGAT